jgi:hypothetical protein
MVGYIDAVMERQDRVNILSKMETFTVEQAARRAVKELIKGFE